MLREILRDVKRFWDSLPWWLKILTLFFGSFLLLGYISMSKRPICQLLSCLIAFVLFILLFPIVAAFFLFYYGLKMLCPHNALECFGVILFYSVCIALEILIFLSAYRRKQRMKRRKRREKRKRK